MKNFRSSFHHVLATPYFTSLITVSFLDQLRLRRQQLREAVVASVADGVLSIGERDAIEGLGERLGLPEHDTAEAVDDVRRDMADLATCPHCGGLLTGARPA